MAQLGLGTRRAQGPTPRVTRKEKKAQKAANNNNVVFDADAQVVSSKKVSDSSMPVVWRYATIDKNGVPSRAYTEDGLATKEEELGTEFPWKIVAFEVKGHDPQGRDILGDHLEDPSTAVSLLKNKGREDLIPKVWNIDRLGQQNPTDAEQQLPATMTPTPATGTVDKASRKAMEILAQFTGANLTPDGEQIPDEKKRFFEQLGISVPARELDDVDLASAVYDRLSQFGRREEVQEMLAEKQGQSIPAAQISTPPPSTPPIPATQAVRQVWMNPQDGSFTDLATGLAVENVWQNPQNGRLFVLDTGEELQPFQPSQSTQPVVAAAQAPTAPIPQPTPAAPTPQPAAPQPQPQPQQSSAIDPTLVTLTPEKQALLCDPEVQVYLNRIVSDAVKADRKDRRARKDSKRQKSGSNNPTQPFKPQQFGSGQQGGNGPQSGAGQAGGGNA